MNKFTLKRIFDLFFTIPGFLLLLPFFIIIAIIIKTTSNGPVFFKQIRIGKNGLEFEIFKFRSMYQDSEKKGKKITVGNDPRITPIGHYLRKYKIDEFPQLINILKGEMTLVGPRPEVPEYVSYYSQEQKKQLFACPPGITSLASLYYRDESDLLAKAKDPEKEYINIIMPNKIKYDLMYTKNFNLMMDFCIILKTINKIK